MNANRVVGGALLTWSVIAAASALRDGLGRDADPVPELDASFQSMSHELPAGGVVGYLEDRTESGADEAVLMHRVAQYALAPRLVVSRVGPEFLIVPRSAPRPEMDPRLDGYYPIATSSGGHRVYRRLAP